MEAQQRTSTHIPGRGTCGHGLVVHQGTIPPKMITVVNVDEFQIISENRKTSQKHLTYVISSKNYGRKKKLRQLQICIFKNYFSLFSFLVLVLFLLTGNDTL